MMINYKYKLFKNKMEIFQFLKILINLIKNLLDYFLKKKVELSLMK